MKVLLYTEGLKAVGKSGLGKAVEHQINALESNNISYTLDRKELDSVEEFKYSLKVFIVSSGSHCPVLLYAFSPPKTSSQSIFLLPL